MSTLREVYSQGYRRVCVGCNKVYKPDSVRKEIYEDGHGGRLMEMCSCGCDLIGYILEKDGKLYICPQDKIDGDCVHMQEGR